MGDVTVTQADRDAAALYAWAEGAVGTHQLRYDIRNGKRDNHPLVEAFARHRLSAQTPEPAQLFNPCTAGCKWPHGTGATGHSENCDGSLPGSALATQQPREAADVVEAADIEWLNMEHSRANSQGDHTKQRMLERLLRAALRTQAPASDEVREAVIEARLALANWSKYENETDELAYQRNKVAQALGTILAALGAKP